jgi:hypothetical protein
MINIIASKIRPILPPFLFNKIEKFAREILNKSNFIEEEFDYDYYTHFYAWLFSRMSHRLTKESWIVDVGGKKLANTVISNFCNLVEITPSDLNFAGSGRKAIVNEDFSSLSGLKLKLVEVMSSQYCDYFIVPATFHLMDLPRYKGVIANPSQVNLRKNNLLMLANEFLRENGTIFLSLPITTNKTHSNKQGFIYKIDDLKEILSFFNFAVEEVNFVLHGNHDISTRLLEKTLYTETDLSGVKFKSENSYVIGYVKALKMVATKASKVAISHKS